ncbi:regulator of nucleoside diphosphate kinase [Salmonella enterica subsp. arizonae]|uniref:Regulator of nucleoside diphosphate kinase n=1 Tax=Salmonella enterica subsp. arizonae TaxID=59203 RepID=A0A379TEC2_SALER|nr:regulator of nucleoside diphosphate kinase [Salmonella enterica subsp. arizonae]
MSRPTIIINDLDAERIDRLLEQPAYADLPIADALNAELDRAQMCSPQEMPSDVVTMNSRVKFRNLSDGETRVRTLVYPANMTDSSTQLSVMAPRRRGVAGTARRRHHSLGTAGRRLHPSRSAGARISA